MASPKSSILSYVFGPCEAFRYSTHLHPIPLTRSHPITHKTPPTLPSLTSHPPPPPFLYKSSHRLPALISAPSFPLPMLRDLQHDKPTHHTHHPPPTPPHPHPRPARLLPPRRRHSRPRPRRRERLRNCGTTSRRLRHQHRVRRRLRRRRRERAVWHRDRLGGWGDYDSVEV